MWPVLLVAVGIDLLVGRRSGLGTAVVAMLMIGLFAGAFWALHATGEVWYGDPVIETISYDLDGSDLSITFPKQPGNPLLLAKRVQSALDADQFTIEVGGELMMIPKSSVKYMTVSPLPEEMPDTVIQGGKIVTS